MKTSQQVIPDETSKQRKASRERILTLRLRLALCCTLFCVLGTFQMSVTLRDQVGGDLQLIGVAGLVLF